MEYKLKIADVVKIVVFVGSLIGMWYSTTYQVDALTEKVLKLEHQLEETNLGVIKNDIEYIKEQSIDFNNMTVLAYFDQIRGSGGYTVEFASVSQTSKSIQAHIKRTASDGNDIEIMTQPYSIVLIEKTDKTVVFIKK